MYKSYLKIAWRNITKNRLFTFLNLVGLSTGLACSVLIYLWVRDELSVDKFNEKDKRLYQVMHNGTSSDGIVTRENTPGLLASALSKEMPDIEYAASVIPSTWFSNKGLVSFNDTHLRADAQFISRDYLNIFSCTLHAGNYVIAIKPFLVPFYGFTNDIIGCIK